MNFCWCTVMVRDLEASVGFYRKVLGLGVDRRFPMPQGGELAFLSDGAAGATQVELIHDPKTAANYEGRGISLGFEVPDLDAALGRMKADGVPIAKGPFTVGGGTRFFYVKDPDGLDIQIVQKGA